VRADLPVPQQDPETVRRAAREILRRPEFQPPKPNIIERILDWIGRQLDRTLGGLGPGTGGANIVGWLLLLVAVGLIIWFVVRLTRQRTRRPPRPGAEVDITSEAGRNAAQWRVEAGRLEAEGHWKDGLRCRYRGLVTDLVDRGVVDDIAGRTSGEYTRDMRTAAPGVAPDFATASDLFERAWYGDRPTGPPERDRFEVAERAVLAGTAA
jgi:hypothetical protein